MPKKSRREKILADIRRRARTEHVQQIVSVQSPVIAQTTTFRFTAPRISKTQEVTLQASTSELAAIKRDLIKTFILASIAIAGEITIYLISHGNI